MRQLIDKALNKEPMLGMIDRAPWPVAHMVIAIDIVHECVLEIIDRVRRLNRLMLLDKLLIPRDRHAIFVKTGDEATDRGGAIPILLCALFARPDHLDREITFRRNLSRHDREIFSRSATKPSA